MRPDRVKLAGVTAALALSSALAVTSAAAADAPPPGFRAAIEALGKGAYDAAVEELELLADRGYVHPDASFNRAVAYVERARSPAAAPGDLGRAAAALHETLLLRPGDAGAELALERVQAEISRRRSQSGAKDVIARPTLARAASGLVSENVWAGGALFGSLALSVGLAARRLSRRPAATLGGAIAIGVGLLLLVLCAAATAAARHFRLSSRPAVVVVSEARLLDESGKVATRKGEPAAVPEGSLVYVTQEAGTLARIEWGATSGYVNRSQLRLLALP